LEFPTTINRRPQLGQLDPLGHARTPDAGAAMRCYRAAAEAGHLEAQRILAWNYLNGRGAPRDTAAAALWFRNAAEQGLPEAQLQLGELYRAGIGTAEDLATARACYEKARASGNVDARLSPYVIRKLDQLK
jgi:uncharacterized protein